ncbi:TniQ family protein [Scytonema sp. NUACC21]
MQDNQFNLQSHWYPQQRNIPQRSHLYPLPPLLLGTPLTESFTSYITRLAATHQVPTGVLLAQELAPKISRYQGPNPDSLSQVFFHIFFNQTGAWNGTGTMALEPLLVLQKLTKQPTLKYLTLMPWSKVLPTRNLLRKYKAWCPLCYSEWSQKGMPLYEPLIWCVSAVKICPIHQYPLMNYCPNCGQNVYLLAWNTKSGFCCRCHSWLGTSCSTLESQLYHNQDVEWQNFVAQQVGELIAQAVYLIESPSRESVAPAINQCIEVATLGNAKAFAQEMYLSLTVPRDWRIGKALPQLNLILRVCYRLSISLIDIYLGRLKIEHPIVLKELPLSEQYSKTNRSFDADKVREFLELHQESSPPQSLKQLAFKIGYDPADLYRHFPDLCRQISARYKLHNKSSFKPRV